MNNIHTKWRIDFAQELAKTLATFEGVKAIVVAGSVARGLSDQYSDIEIPIFWEVLPDDPTRHEIVAALNADFVYAYDGPAREDQLLIHGLQVDLWHVASAHQGEIIDAVLNDHQTGLSALNALDTVRYCIPLYGQELVQMWKRRALAYPDDLAEKIVCEHLASFSVGGLFTSAKRDNPTAFYSQLSFLQQEAFLVLLGLNRRYFPTYKWIYPVLESMQVKPESIEQRFRKAYQTPYQEAIEVTKNLLEEIVHLAEDQFPHIDTAPVFHRLSYRRSAQFGGEQL